MISKSKIQFAIIGLGHIGKHHAEMIKQNPNADGSITTNALEGLKVVEMIERIYKHKPTGL